MTRLQTVALWLIALLLAGHLAIEYIRPVIVLAVHEESFTEAARRCHEARSNYREVRGILEDYEGRTAVMLQKSAIAGLTECYERDDLHLSMLASGVNPYRIERLDLIARNASKASLPYLTDGLTGGL